MWCKPGSKIRWWNVIHLLFDTACSIRALEQWGYFVPGAVCIILAVTNAGYVETSIIGVHNSAPSWSIQHTTVTYPPSNIVSWFWIFVSRNPINPSAVKITYLKFILSGNWTRYDKELTYGRAGGHHVKDHAPVFQKCLAYGWGWRRSNWVKMGP